MASFFPLPEQCPVVKTLAQQRRQLENEEFCLLAKELPLARAISGQHIDKLIDSFFLIMDSRGDVLYVSETISIYLGLSQVEMMGNNFIEYVHLDDWQRFQTIFHPRPGESSANIRIRSSLTKRVTKDSIRASPGFKVIRMEIVVQGGNRLCHCSPLPSLVLSTVSIQNEAFVLTLTLDLKIYSVDEKAEQILASCCQTLKDLSFYQLIHVDDTLLIRKMHFEVFALGAYKTPFYRMIRRDGQSFHVESSVYRYSFLSYKKVTVETITIVTVVL